MAQEKRQHGASSRSSRYLKKNKSDPRRALVGILTAAAAVVSTLLSAHTLTPLWSNRGLSSASSAASSGSSTAIMDYYDNYINNIKADALTDLEGLERPRKTYFLSDEVLIAPEPDAASFGTTTNPKDLEPILEQARRRLDLETTIFSTDITLYEGSSITWYLDDTIFSVTWRQVINDAVYTFAETKIAHASQLRRFLADGTFGSEKMYYPTEMATTVNAVTASAGDFYKFRDYGVIVYNGKVQRVDSHLDTCYIDEAGNMLFTKAGEITTMSQAEAYVAENHVRFSLAFGPILVRDGEYVENKDSYPVGQGEKKYSRAAICQLGDLHYLMATVNLGVNGQHRNTLRVNDWAKFLAGLGVRQAYALDGGQTATIVMNDTLINRPDYGTQRKISDIIYFATAIPAEE